MTTPTELKQVTFTGTAAVQDGKIKLVRLDTCAIDGEPAKPVGELQLASRVDVIRAAFAPGDRVTVVDGRGMKTSLGSPGLGDWTDERVSCIGQTGMVVLIDHEGDVVVEGLACKYWSPAHLRKAGPAFAAGDRVTVVDGRKIETSFGSRSAREWDDKRVACIGQTGTVETIDRDGDVVVEGLARQFWAPAHLRKVGVEFDFKVGDSVVCERVQTGYPNWIKTMTPTVGRVGKILEVPSVGVARVVFPGAGRYLYAKSWLRLATPAEIAAAKTKENAVFAVGDRVTVVDSRGAKTSTDTPAALVWTDRQVACIGQTGTVVAVDSNGDVAVEGLDCQHWAPEQLRKETSTPTFKRGDLVVCDRVQSGAPHWISGMTSTLGRVGKIADYDDDGVYKVTYGRLAYYYAKDWLRPATQEEIAAARGAERGANNAATSERSELPPGLALALFLRAMAEMADSDNE